MYWHDGWGWGAGLVMFVLTVAFWVGLAAIIGSVVKGRGAWRGPGGDAQAILDQRFARGEIDQAEYESRSAALRGSRSFTG